MSEDHAIVDFQFGSQGAEGELIVLANDHELGERLEMIGQDSDSTNGAVEPLSFEVAPNLQKQQFMVGDAPGMAALSKL